MHQYFSVGEEVILTSVMYPELSGDYLISSCLGVITDLDTGVRDVCYSLIPPVGKYNSWAQRSLRKKHKPSEFKSLSELIKSTKEVKA